MLRTLAAAAVAWLVLAPGAWAETLEGRVVSVHDGDTMQVDVGGGRREKVRLVGIDAPEISQEPWGTRSRDFTRALALGKDVRVETDVQPRDRYGRLLGYVYAGRTFVNLEAIKAGHAVLLTYPPNVKHVDAFTAAQAEARAKGRGVWDPKEPLPESPYQHRHKNDGQKPGYTRGPKWKVASPGPSGPSDPRQARPAVQDAPNGQVRFNPRSKKIHPPGCGHECPSCQPMTMAEAQQRGGVVCKRPGQR